LASSWPSLYQPLLLFGRDAGVGRDHLERDRAVRCEVVGAIDDARTTSTYLSLDDEAAS
jgi:hypothetical protein